MTAVQSRLNLRTASRNVAARIGVTPPALTYAERIVYNRELAAEILKYPQSFTAEVLAIADNIAGKTYSPLEDTSFDWGEFAGEVGANATFTAHWLLPAAAIMGIVVGLNQLTGGGVVKFIKGLR